MKRVLSLILAVSMVMSMFTFSFAGTTLKDVDGTEYQAAVEALVELGIVNGYEDGTYRPEQNVSRAEMAKLLVVAAGLEPAAKLVEGATKFADVNGGWASGYVNVASEYGYVMGYPDGTFRPDETVSYAEAATMALRVLGYKSVVEAKGTWPTNYIAKAEDLELLEDITYASYNDGAARGNVAILIWNMLKTAMWDVTGESDGDGLHYEDTTAMLNVKFPDYSYSYAEFVDFEINGDGEVEVTLRKVTDSKHAYELEATTYVYEGVDFYTFVPNTEVEVLVNEEDELLLTMVATGSDKLVEGDKLTLDEDYDALDAVEYDYAYTIIERKEIASERTLAVTSEMIVEKTEKADKYVKLNKVKYENDDYDYEVIIKDGERATINDIEVGDVLTVVTLDNEEVFYMVSRDTAEGKLTKYVVKEYEDAEELEYHVLTVGGEEYLMDPAATYVEDPEDEDEKQTKSFASGHEDDMRGEVVTLIRDFLGRVVRVEFDGSIDEETKEVKFFAVTEEVEKEGVGSYVIGLENKDESDTYKFAKSCATAKALYQDDALIAGSLVAVSFNDDDEITALTVLARAGIEGLDFTEVVEGLEETTEGNYVTTETEIVYKEAETEDEEDDVYTLAFIEGAEYDEDDEVITATNEDDINVDEGVIVISLLADDNGSDDDNDDDEYTAEFATGLAALEDLRDDEILVITDSADTFGFAKIIVRFGDNTTREDDLVGIVEEARENKIGDFTITIDDVTYTFRAKDNEGLTSNTVASYEGSAILFSVETDKDEEEYATVVSQLTTEDITTELARVEDTTSNAVAFTEALFTGATETFKDSFHKAYDEYLFVRVVVDYDEDEIDSVEDPVLGTDIDAKFFAEDDAVIVDDDNEVVWVIEGIEWPEEDASTNEPSQEPELPTDEPTQDPVQGEE